MIINLIRVKEHFKDVIKITKISFIITVIEDYSVVSLMLIIRVILLLVVILIVYNKNFKTIIVFRKI